MSKIIQNNITWNDIDWGQTQSKVRKIQYRIYQATICGNTKRKHWLQKTLINSESAKLIATRQVTTLNKGKRTAGIDRVKITTPQEKLRLALKLKLDGKAQPIRRVWVPKPGKEEKRPLGIPILEDRAKQALAKLVLEPEWEAIFEPDSYGFRPGRNALDAIEAIFLNMRGSQKWVFDADIRKCFDMINHDTLLEKLKTFPIMKKQIRAWLKSGVMEGYANSMEEKEILSTDVGTPQGGIISPLLANIALHGLQNHLKDYVGKLPIKPHPGSNRGKAAKIKALGVIRYADDFVLIHRNKEILELCIEETRKWLKNIGLEISEEKSALRDGREGFQFLGFQIILVKKSKKIYKVKIHPSRKSQSKLLTKVREIIQKHKAVSSYDLIQMLRPVILGWANYFKYSECKDDFSKLTHRIFEMIRAWVFRRDTRNGRRAVKEKYFPNGKTYKFDGSQHFDNWILTGSKKIKGQAKVENYLPHLVWVKSRKHAKVKGSESPYNKGIYWSLRSNKYSPYPLRIRTLLVKQKQVCPICKKKLTSFDSSNWEVDHIIPKSEGGRDVYGNLQLLHRVCHVKKTRKELGIAKTKSEKSGEYSQEPNEAKVSRSDLKTRFGVNPKL